MNRLKNISALAKLWQRTSQTVQIIFLILGISLVQLTHKYQKVNVKQDMKYDEINKNKGVLPSFGHRIILELIWFARTVLNLFWHMAEVSLFH
jgi:hypothetical protein